MPGQVPQVRDDPGVKFLYLIRLATRPAARLIWNFIFLQVFL